MAIRYDIDLRNNVVYLGAYGVISVADIEAAIKEIEANADFSQKMTSVIDVREIKRAFFVREMDRLIELLANEAAHFVHHYAFIVSRDIGLGAVGRRFPVKARQQGLTLEFFNDYVAAVKWLRSVY